MTDSTIKGANPETHDGSNLRVGIVHARWNATIIDSLLKGVRKSLASCNVQEDNIGLHSVPGSWELPSAAAALLAGSHKYDVLIAIGVLIKGQTMHFEYIADAVSHGLMRVQLDQKLPVIFGVLTVLNDEQAKVRAGLAPHGHNHGEDWGLAAVEMGTKQLKWQSS